MAQRVTHRTVGLDVSGLAASNDRKKVSQFIVEHFAHFNIHAVQFVGTIAKVTFAVEASKQQVICHQSININGVQCAVRGGGPRAQNVLVYNYPVEGNEESIRRKLAVYGTVESMAFRHWPHLPNVSDGVRVVRMVRREAIPRHLSIGKFQVKISYAGQQQVCDLCAIMYKPKLTLVASFCDTSGHFVHCSFSFADVTFNVACLYAPDRNPARDQFFDYVLDVVNPDPPTILCGDFNTVFDRGLDRSGSDVNDLSRESTPSLIRLLNACMAVDIWRVLNPSSRSFSWLRPNGSAASYIDLVGLPVS